MQVLLICFQYKWKKANNKAHKLQIVHLISSHTNIIIKKTERKEADLMEQPRVIYQPFKRLKMALRSKKRKRSSIIMGVVTTILASLSFTFMSACAKWLPEMPSGEMTLFRGIVGLFFIPLLCLQTKEHFFQGSISACYAFEGFWQHCALFYFCL